MLTSSVYHDFSITEKIVEPNRQKRKYYYYHRKFNRVPTIDTCEIGDLTCFVEAHEQFRRDK